MISFSEISNIDESNYWMNLYDASFPEYEKTPFNDLVQMSNSDHRIKMYLVKYNDNKAGIIYLVDMNTKAFILYFAIDSSIRGQGLGKLVINALNKEFKDGFILECESTIGNFPNSEQRDARYRFYMKNGLIDTNLFSRDSGQNFHLLTSNEKCTKDNYLYANKLLGISSVDVLKRK